MHEPSALYAYSGQGNDRKSREPGGTRVKSKHANFTLSQNSIVILCVGSFVGYAKDAADFGSEAGTSN